MTNRHRGRRDTAARALLAPRVDAGLAECWRCGLPITPGQLWDAGHLYDLATGGDPRGPRLPEHALKKDCPAGGNRAAGARLRLELAAIDARRARRRRTRLAEWLAHDTDIPTENMR